MDAFQEDLNSTAEDEIDDDFMMAIRPNHVHIYCNPSNYNKLIDKQVNRVGAEKEGVSKKDEIETNRQTLNNEP